MEARPQGGGRAEKQRSPSTEFTLSAVEVLRTGRRARELGRYLSPAAPDFTLLHICVGE